MCETTHGRNDPGRNDSGRNDPRAKRPTGETTHWRNNSRAKRPGTDTSSSAYASSYFFRPTAAFWLKKTVIYKSSFLKGIPTLLMKYFFLMSTKLLSFYRNSLYKFLSQALDVWTDFLILSFFFHFYLFCEPS